MAGAEQRSLHYTIPVPRLPRAVRLGPGIRTKLLASFVLVAMFTGALGLIAAATGDRLNTSRDTLY
jgi:hypothetical protein